MSGSKGCRGRPNTMIRLKNYTICSYSAESLTGDSAGKKMRAGNGAGAGWIRNRNSVRKQRLSWPPEHDDKIKELYDLFVLRWVPCRRLSGEKNESGKRSGSGVNSGTETVSGSRGCRGRPNTMIRLKNYTICSYSAESLAGDSAGKKDYRIMI